MNAPSRQFASDNGAGVCPEVWAALQTADAVGHTPGYGSDAFTERAIGQLREVFETDDFDAHFVFNGTAANSLVMAAACEPFQAVICHAYSHIETDESNAPGFFAHGVKTLPIDSEWGKLVPADVERVFKNRRDIHASAPRVLSLTQATELGTVYSSDELRALCDSAHALDMVVHVDGARFANAVAGLGNTPAELTWKAGVDALCFGGTKNGALGSEAVLLFNPELRADFKRRCKQSGQLASKMRYHAAQWIGLLEGGVWRRNAENANAMAAHLTRRLAGLAGVRVLYPTQANAVFVALPDGVADAMRERGWRFYDDVGPAGSRLMCSWDTQTDDIEALVAALSDELQEQG